MIGSNMTLIWIYKKKENNVQTANSQTSCTSKPLLSIALKLVSFYLMIAIFPFHPSLSFYSIQISSAQETQKLLTKKGTTKSNLKKNTYFSMTNLQACNIYSQSTKSIIIENTHIFIYELKTK